MNYIHYLVYTSYAAPLKAALVEMTGLPPKYFKDIKLKETELDFLGKSPREIMQLFGTEFVREMIHPNFWVWRMQRYLDSQNTLSRDKLRDVQHVVIDDCRFENEVTLVRDNKGIVVHLERQFQTVTVHANHKSEQVLERNPKDVYINSGVSGEEVTYNMLMQELKRCF